jgi:hypothetical protein
MKTVTFQLKGEYIDQIKAGSKVKEYRFPSGYNIKRLCYPCDDLSKVPSNEIGFEFENEFWLTRKDLTHVQFFNGYRKDRKELVCELRSIKIVENPEGEAPGEDWFVLSLGRIVKTKNFK